MTRTDDERLLSLLAARRAGHSTYTLAAVTGLRDSYIRTATNRVRDADLRESGDADHEVRAHYPSGSTTWGRA